MNGEGKTMGNKERHILSNWQTGRKVESKLAPGEFYIVKVFTCPRCKKESDPIEHGERRTCDCGLTFEAWGNALDLWED